MVINQVLAVAAYGDATTNDALALRDVFRQRGTSTIYSHHPPDPRLAGVRQLREFPSPGPNASGDVLLVHFSIGQREVFDFVMARAEKLVLRYHNVSPPQLFERFDPVFAERLRESRDELSALRPRVDLAIADSRFNAEDLRSLGYQDPVVVPLILDLEQLTGAAPARPTFPLPDRGAGPVVLFVGRLAPGKGHPALIEAFHILKTYLRPDTHLVLVGSSNHVDYEVTVERMIADLRLPDVVIAGHVSNAELAAAYRRADVFVCLSEHEGFGVPLIEAMAFGVPVIAAAAAAVPETVATGGLMLPDASPALVAEAIAAVLSDADLRRRMIAAGRRRVADLRPEPIARQIRSLVEQIPR